MPEATSQVLVLAPVGRDAAACVSVVGQIGLSTRACTGIEDLMMRLDLGADVVLLTEEALYGKAIEPLAGWVAAQPPWSDQPFVVLTSHNEGARFLAFRRELVAKLRNVAFLERPLQVISLQAAVLGARRGRTRQYEARAYLERQQGAAAELERLVSERTKALEEANRQLREESERRERTQSALLQSQKVEAMGQLVGGVAHDFNNLLMAVIGSLDLLARSVSDDRHRMLVQRATEGALRGASLTQRLLAFARRQELKTTATDVAALVEDMRHLIVESLGPVVALSIESEGGLPAASVDPHQLEMALLNLAVNARDAMPSGGRLLISIDQQEVAVEEDGLKPGRYVRLSAEDTGEGMTPATLAQAIEPFFSTKGVGKGTGLGLSMVHGMAQQSGGAFRLQSTLGVGTRAELWLPVAGDAVNQPAELRVDPAAVTPSTILVVDDDTLIASSTQALLEDLGHSAVAAYSGAEALALVEGGMKPDLVITDYAMPGMTGTQLAVELRRRNLAVPILLATGYAELKGSQGVELPRLAKPYNQTQLAAEISRLLG